MKAFTEFFSENLLAIDQIEALFLNRKRESYVTRFAPSPTGFLHLGGIYAALLSRYVAKRPEDVFMLRIEDTDRAREVPGATDLLVDTLSKFGISWDEGEMQGGSVVGNYGPYRQSLRKDFYHAYAQWLIAQNLAYPCFATQEELDQISESQRALGKNPGYYGRWAIWRGKDEAAVRRALKDERPYVIRFRSHGGEDTRVRYHDLVRGELELPEAYQDSVLIKSDGMPTYHFAHVVDDHLMRTTHVIRGDEWISSVPLHLALFQAIGATAPKYAHIAPLQVQDGTSRRKLSKRKDPEADARFYLSGGYPPVAIKSYLLNVATSKFESWRKENRDAPIDDFPLSIEDLNTSGALLDFDKLDNISRNYFVEQQVDQLASEGIEWAKNYDSLLHDLWTNDIEFFVSILASQRAMPSRPRKDLSKWSEFRDALGFFYDELFHAREVPQADLEDALKHSETCRAILKIRNGLDDIRDSVQFTQLVKSAAESEEINTSRQRNEDLESAHISDVYAGLKLLLCSKKDSMDLWTVIATLGIESARRRLDISDGGQMRP